MNESVTTPTRVLEEAIQIVEAYLDASMIPDPVTAARFIAPDLVFTFTGGRRFDHPRDAAAFNAKRAYKWMEREGRLSPP